MNAFATVSLATATAERAPDGSIVHPLLRVPAGSLAQFSFASGSVTRAVLHRSVDELWYVVAGRGELWRWRDGREEVVALDAGVGLSIPCGTRFQLRAGADAAVVVIATTLPPWPGDDEAVVVDGPWSPTGSG